MIFRIERLATLLHQRRRPPHMDSPQPQPLNQAAAETLAHVAHELSQPLSAALAAFQLIRSPEDTGHRRHATAVIDRQLHQLRRIVDDLVETARVRIHRPSLHMTMVDLRAITEQVVDAVTPQAAVKHLRVTVSLPECPVVVFADFVRLQQVTSNLLTNAIKYTGAGGWVRVAVRQHQNNALLTVADSGQGITPALLPKMFDPFVQGTSTTHGLGVGLAIARQLVILHGGTIRAESAGPGRGSTFVVALPISRTTALDACRPTA
jgi:signal transduction histidine kinase